MIGYILTQTQADEINDVFFTEDTFFNPILDINGVHFIILSEQDKIHLENTQWQWILDLPSAEYIAPPDIWPPIL